MVAESKRRKTNHETSSPGYGSRGKNGALALPESEDEEESGAPDDEESEAEPSRAPTPPPAPKETANQPQQTNLNTLNDPIALAGVDLAAEDEAIRESNRRPTQANAARASAPVDFIDKKELQKKVTATASAGSMKTLKADTLDLISAAAQQRLRNILEAVVKARDHRLRIHAARPPPNYPDVQDQPVWDIDVGEDVDKILAVMAKVDRDEEKTARRARIAKEEVELQEKQAAEAAARENEEDGQDGATTRKKQKETSARNLTEEQQAKMTNASTRQMLFGAGGSKYSWLSGPPSSSGNGTPNPLPLPSLPGGTLLGGNTGSSANTPTSSGNTNAGGMAASVLNPSRAPGDATDDEEASEAGKVIWQDLQFALMHERGTGVGQGTGQHSFTKASLLRGR